MTGAGRLSSGPQPVTANPARTLTLAASMCAVPAGSPVAAQALRQGGSPKGEKPAKPEFQRSRQRGPDGETPASVAHDKHSDGFRLLGR